MYLKKYTDANTIIMVAINTLYSSADWKDRKTETQHLICSLYGIPTYIGKKLIFVIYFFNLCVYFCEIGTVQVHWSSLNGALSRPVDSIPDSPSFLKHSLCSVKSIQKKSKWSLPPKKKKQNPDCTVIALSYLYQS